ncbi:hypothetical protein PBI_CHE12_48 [Mycobacterium phage Che12]|uniref:Uncharacterized protein n=1 Tax=Mycobacterium phage Che12 TaxID=2911435 RepID=Q1A0G9_9CAUD|nr:gp48 [Mycobacterium phage Che12]ABE67367.1 hypothetical protein PBI_CHE12_48 [Mycobacterium phage Che12]
MLIKDVERYTIPLGSPEFGNDGTTVEDLIKALKKLPPKALVSTDYGGSNLFVTHNKPDIDSDCPFEAVLQQVAREMALSTLVPHQYYMR